MLVSFVNLLIVNLIFFYERTSIFYLHPDVIERKNERKKSLTTRECRGHRFPRGVYNTIGRGVEITNYSTSRACQSSCDLYPRGGGHSLQGPSCGVPHPLFYHGESSARGSSYTYPYASR